MKIYFQFPFWDTIDENGVDHWPFVESPSWLLDIYVEENENILASFSIDLEVDENQFERKIAEMVLGYYQQNSSLIQTQDQPVTKEFITKLRETVDFGSLLKEHSLNFFVTDKELICSLSQSLTQKKENEKLLAEIIEKVNIFSKSQKKST